MLQGIKLAGACYLLYMGWRTFFNRTPVSQDLSARPPISPWQALYHGFLTNALNPKTTVFIVSLFMQVVRPDTPLPVQLGYGAFISLAHVAWFCLVALCFSSDGVRQRLLAVRHWIDRIFGGLLIGFGVLLAAGSASR